MEPTQPPQKENQQPNTSVASTAKTAATAITAAAKAYAGNIAGALKDLASDENIRRIVIAIVLVTLFIMLFGSMMLSSAVTGTIENIKKGYLDNYIDIYEEHAINANGSTFSLYNFDQQAAQNEAIARTIVDAINALFKKNSAYENDNIPGVPGTSIDDSIYDTTLRAVKEKEAFIGEDGALQQRLDLIKGRVEQRGQQLKNIATGQYAISALGMAIGAYLDNRTSEPYLFAGIDYDNSTLDINTRAFELSDIQALKILAAYSIQKDCSIQNIDMWDLMNYCGWYAAGTDSLPTKLETSHTIYDTMLNAQYGMDIAGVVSDGEAVTNIYNLAEPEVPYWDGSCAPQWYYEQISQIKKNNALYDKYTEQGKTDLLQNMIRYPENANGQLIISGFENLSNCETFGLIDKIYTTTAANIVISRTEYHGADEWYREAMDTLTGASLQRWIDAFSGATKYTNAGNRVYKDANGNHSFTLYGGQPGYRYYIINRSTGWTSSHATGRTMSFYGLTAGRTYDVYKAKGPVNHPTISEITWIDSFTTFDSGNNYEAYKLQIDVNVTYGAQSIDQLIEDILGLWPGSLGETITGTDGREYAQNNADNALLARTWTDTYKDDAGQIHTLNFQRQTGYQKEAYQDFVLAIAQTLGFDTANLFGYEGGSGQTIVDIAMNELALYQAEGLYEGGRYWDMIYEATGVRYPANTAWCVCFVVACAWQAGLMGEGNAWEGVEWTYWCSGLYSELVNNGVADGYDTPGSDYKPVPGDIVFFAPSVGSGNLHHVGLVKEVTADGNLVTIEGNKSDVLRMDTYSGYTLGTHAYSNCVIAAYCHPYYPATYLTDPIYETVPNSINPSVNARMLLTENQQIFLAGMGRFRWTQMPIVLDALQQSHSELYDEELRTHYDTDNMQAFCNTWNAIARSGKKNNFQAAQRKILNEEFVQPVVNAVKSETGFDWKKSNVREQILLGIVTTTDQTQACIGLLNTISSAFTNNVTDDDFLTVLSTNNFLYNYCSSNKNYMWPYDPPSTQDKWCLGIQCLLEEVIDRKDELNCYELEVDVTHYCACAICCGTNADGYTASGKRVQEGMIATSSYYPFGTKFRINGVLYTVEDRGGYGIESNIHRVDIYVSDHDYAWELGRFTTTATVYPVN